MFYAIGSTSRSQTAITDNSLYIQTYYKLKISHPACVRSLTAPLGTAALEVSHLFLLVEETLHPRALASHSKSYSIVSPLSLTLDFSHFTYSSPSSFLYVTSLL